VSEEERATTDGRERESVACDFASFGVVATGVEQKKRKSDAPKKTANETEERTGQDRTGERDGSEERPSQCRPTCYSLGEREREGRHDRNVRLMWVVGKTKWDDGFGLMGFKTLARLRSFIVFALQKLNTRAFLPICDWGDTSAISSTTRVLSRSPPCLA
jgi:hypothetical protein